MPWPQHPCLFWLGSRKGDTSYLAVVRHLTSFPGSCHCHRSPLRITDGRFLFLQKKNQPSHGAVKMAQQDLFLDDQRPVQAMTSKAQTCENEPTGACRSVEHNNSESTHVNAVLKKVMTSQWHCALPSRSKKSSEMPRRSLCLTHCPHGFPLKAC